MTTTAPSRNTSRLRTSGRTSIIPKWAATLEFPHASELEAGDGGSALDIDDYLQELALGPMASALLTSEKARPALVESPIGGGAHLHAEVLVLEVEASAAESA